MDRLYLLTFCLIASCYLDVGSSGVLRGNDGSDDEREAAPVVVESEDAAARDAVHALPRDAGAQPAISDDSGWPDAATDSGAPVPRGAVEPAAAPAESLAFSLTSPAFAHGARLPDAFTCNGADRSPPFRWSNPPAGVQAFALVLTATRAARPASVEWVLWNIPGDSRTLPEGMAAGRDPSNVSGIHQESLSELERTAIDLGVTAGAGAAPLLPAPLSLVGVPSPLDLVRRPRYRGPCAEQSVSYEFTLFALDAAVASTMGLFVSLEAVTEWMKTRSGALGQARIVATYP